MICINHEKELFYIPLVFILKVSTPQAVDFKKFDMLLDWHLLEKNCLSTKVFVLLFKALVNITDQQIYCDLVAGEEDNSFLKE